ncbi:Conserved_hypothetical protein [Hexamita inflata]|uniref:Uncharacterized protein n=1 Tax=Hexamita inflata TaxID=28002 RepID=A0AA86R8F3_9EUKA|nr:Conserved hypothetical protein [Hexamita inflata]
MDVFLTNPYQLNNYVIKYTSQKLLVTDENNDVVDSFDIKYTNDTQGEYLDQNRYFARSNTQYNRLIYLNNNFYTLIRDNLFQIDMNNFTFIDRIPENKSSGFAKMCLFNNQILVTNERQFFKLDNKFEEMKFYFDDQEIIPYNVVLYDFNGHSTISTEWNKRQMLFEIGEPNCKLLFSGSILKPLIASSGFQVFQLDNDSAKLVLDLTQDQIQVSYCFENYSSSVQTNNYVTEYELESMRKILPDYDNFNLRRNKIYEEMQAKMPPKVPLESVITKMYPEITPDKFVFQNSYQLENKLIFYKGSHAYVTDMNKNVLERVPINFILGKISQQRFNNKISIDRFNNYDQLWYCNNTVYALLHDILFRVDLFKFKELQKIPGEYGSGYVRICVYNDQILTTNEKQFFLYNPVLNKFVEKKFYIDKKLIQPYQVALYSYGQNAIARIIEKESNSNVYFIVVLQENSCLLLHVGKQIENIVPAQGLSVFSLQNGTCCVTDLTLNPITVKYYAFDESNKFKNNFKFVNNGIEYSKEIMDLFVDDNFFERRNQIYQNEIQRICFKQLNKQNKFGRFEQPTKMQQLQSNLQSFTDIFNMTCQDIEPFQKLFKEEFSLKQIRINSQSSFRRRQLGDFMGLAPRQQGDMFIQPPFGDIIGVGGPVRGPLDFEHRPNPEFGQQRDHLFGPAQGFRFGQPRAPFGFGGPNVADNIFGRQMPQNFDQFREQ